MPIKYQYLVPETCPLWTVAAARAFWCQKIKDNLFKKCPNCYLVHTLLNHLCQLS